MDFAKTTRIRDYCSPMTFNRVIRVCEQIYAAKQRFSNRIFYVRIFHVPWMQTPLYEANVPDPFRLIFDVNEAERINIALKGIPKSWNFPSFISKDSYKLLFKSIKP